MDSDFHSSSKPTRNQLLAVAGALLALMLLALLVSVMNDNVAQAQSTRDAVLSQTQERGRCALQRKRLDREQCLLDVRLSHDAPESAQSQAQVQTQR